MEQKKQKAQPRLTNEEVSKKFANQFDLVRYAIDLATNMILTGREPRVKSDTQNTSVVVLHEIIAGKDTLDPVNLDAVLRRPDAPPRHQGRG